MATARLPRTLLQSTAPSFNGLREVHPDRLDRPPPVDIPDLTRLLVELREDAGPPLQELWYRAGALLPFKEQRTLLFSTRQAGRSVGIPFFVGATAFGRASDALRAGGTAPAFGHWAAVAETAACLGDEVQLLAIIGVGERNSNLDRSLINRAAIAAGEMGDARLAAAALLARPTDDEEFGMRLADFVNTSMHMHPRRCLPAWSAECVAAVAEERPLGCLRGIAMVDRVFSPGDAVQLVHAVTFTPDLLNRAADDFRNISTEMRDALRSAAQAARLREQVCSQTQTLSLP